MSSFRFVTLGRVALLGPSGPVLLDDARHVAVLALLAAAPGRSLTTNEILLVVWPHLTVARGGDALGSAASAIATAAGADLLGVAAGRWTLTEDVICDFDTAEPSAAPSFLAGVVLPDTPEWDEWVATARREIAVRPRQAVRSGRRRWLVGLAGGAAIVALGWTAARPRSIAGFEPGDRVVLADVRGVPGDSALARSLQLAAVAGLQQSSRIDLYPVARIAASLRALGRGLDGDGLTAELALDVAIRDSVPWVLAIELAPDGDRFRVTTRFIRAATRETVLTSSRVATGMLDLIGVVGETLRVIQRRVGEPVGRLSGQLGLEVATTSNLQALEAYSDGAAAWRRGEFTLAQNYWLRAVTLDTGFATAMGSLGAYYYHHHDRETGERYYRQALARLGRLTEWERLNIEERYANARGDSDSALALSRTIASIYPRASTFYNLGTGLLQARRCPEALEALEQSRRLDPAAPTTHVNIATCFRRLGQHERARTAYLAAGRLDSTLLYTNNLNLEFAGTLLLTGRAAEAESALTRMAARPGSMADQALGFRGLGYLAFWRGEIARAGEFFRRAAGLSRQQGSAGSLLRNLALLAAVQQAAGDQTGVRRTLAELDSLAAFPRLPPGFLTLAVEPHAAEGNVARIRALLNEMQARADPRNGDDSAQVQYVTGTLALAEENPRAAMAAFDRAARHSFPLSLAYRRAMAHERLGQLDSARVALRRIVAAPAFGSEDQIAWTRAAIGLGEIEERIGRYDEAVASYRRFLDRWSHADPGLPDMVRVRARLAALLSRQDR